jgi:hypothetical protein
LSGIGPERPKGERGPTLMPENAYRAALVALGVDPDTVLAVVVVGSGGVRAVVLLR